MSGSPVAAKVQAPAQRQLQPAAILTVISGDVLVRFGASDFSSAADGAVLYVGSTIRTSADARAVITLFEGSTVELDSASDITIEASTTRGGSTLMEFAQSLGRSWQVVTHLTTADSRYELRTPAATASVRGITFEIAVDDGPTGLMTTLRATERLVATPVAATTNVLLVAPVQTTTMSANSAPVSARSASGSAREVRKAFLQTPAARAKSTERSRDRGGRRLSRP